MYKLLLLMLLFSAFMPPESFIVEKLGGRVLVQKGTEENWAEVKMGDKFSASDLLVTGDKAFVQLSKGGSSFFLKGNSAVSLGSIKKLTRDELLLALTMEEIKNVPKKNNAPGVRSTAVYGSHMGKNPDKNTVSNGLGAKKLNGARQLAESGFSESAVVVAKETMRKYPETQQNASDRIYFAGILEKLNLFDEAYSEYSKINALSLTEKEKALVKGRLDILASKISQK